MAEKRQLTAIALKLQKRPARSQRDRQHRPALFDAVFAYSHQIAELQQHCFGLRRPHEEEVVHSVEMLFDVPLNQRSVANVVAAMIASHVSRLRAGRV